MEDWIQEVEMKAVASVFGEQWCLEPMPAEKKAKWNKELNWLLSVTDYIVEFVASQQKKAKWNKELDWLLSVTDYIVEFVASQQKSKEGVSMENGKTSLGDSIYKSITYDFFNSEKFLSSIDLSTEQKIIDIKNRIEASVVIWKRKVHKEIKSSWGPSVILEKRGQFEERAETILLILKRRYPGIPKSALDKSKILYNKLSCKHDWSSTGKLTIKICPCSLSVVVYFYAGSKMIIFCSFYLFIQKSTFI